MKQSLLVLLKKLSILLLLIILISCINHEIDKKLHILNYLEIYEKSLIKVQKEISLLTQKNYIDSILLVTDSFSNINLNVTITKKTHYLVSDFIFKDFIQNIMGLISRNSSILN